MTNYKLKEIFERRVQQKRWIFIIAAIPAMLFALWGWEYGAFFLYFPLAAICLCQFFYPTIAGWGFLFAVYSIGAVFYVYVFIRDIIQLILGDTSAASIFVDLDDSFFFLILITVIVSVAFGLYRMKPKKVAT